jgi:hypothetical protein
MVQATLLGFRIPPVERGANPKRRVHEARRLQGRLMQDLQKIMTNLVTALIRH